MFARLLLIGLLAVIAWAVVARASEGAAPGRPYTVRPHDTLWTIAAAHYGGDPREGIWKIERRNHLSDPLIRPGQRLVLP
ncbi:MAG TPA: LysM peptidoglycan-binding domain-containing protein [Gaiellaceae bacterium]|jgi:LysM repeat protein|nr:LysM peptidoglycan-binding domain-containing protein [Gaiellaceae bacterium]